MLSYSVQVVVNNFLLIDATDKSKISSDQKRFLSPYTFTPFNLNFSGYREFRERGTGIVGLEKRVERLERMQREFRDDVDIVQRGRRES